MIFEHIRLSQTSISFPSFATTGSSFILLLFFFCKIFLSSHYMPGTVQVLKFETQWCKTYTSIISILGRSPALIFFPHCYLQSKNFHGKETSMWQMHSHSHMKDIPSFSITTLYLKRHGSEVIMNPIVFPNKRKCNFTLM